MKKLLALTSIVVLAALGGSWSDGSAAAADWSSAKPKVAPLDDCVAKPKVLPSRSVLLRAKALSWSDGSRYVSRGLLAKAPKCGGAAGLYWLHQQPGNTHWGSVCYNQWQSVWLGWYTATCLYRW